MADTVQYEVLRAHEGDKSYAPGDTREAKASDVAHLIGTTLAKKNTAAVPQNKAAPAPSNKGRK